MKPLTNDQLAAGSPLGRRLVQECRAGRLAAPYNEQFTDRIVIRVAAAASEVGDLEIVDDGDEYTVYIGRHTHTHFTPDQSLDRETEEATTLEGLLQYVNDILSDKVVIWSSPSGSGGTFDASLGPGWRHPDARYWLWSGKSGDAA